MKHNVNRTTRNGLMITTSLMALAFVPGCTWLNNVASDWPPQNEQQRSRQQAPAESVTRSADSPGAMTGVQREYRYTRMPEQPERQQRGVNNNMAGPRGLQVEKHSNNGMQRSQARGGKQAGNDAGDRQLRQRLRRIEQQLTKLRRDFADIKPVMRKVRAAENQIHQLSRELSGIDGGTAGPSRSQSRRPAAQADRTGRDVHPSKAANQRNAVAPPMTWQQAHKRAQQQARSRYRQGSDERRQSYQQQQQQASQQARQQQQYRQQFRGKDSDRAQKRAGSAYVKDVRTGIFKGNTRLVLDLSRPADFSYDLDNREGLLVVEVERASWRAPEKQEMPGSDLVSAISASTTRQGGSRMVVELSEDAEVVRARALPPTGNNGHRIFMDLKAQ